MLTQNYKEKTVGQHQSHKLGQMNKNIISFHLSIQFYLKDKYCEISKDAMTVCLNVTLLNGNWPNTLNYQAL